LGRDFFGLFFLYAPDVMTVVGCAHDRDEGFLQDERGFNFNNITALL
jgi:hypothetical protein